MTHVNIVYTVKIVVCMPHKIRCAKKVPTGTPYDV